MTEWAEGFEGGVVGDPLTAGTTFLDVAQGSGVFGASGVSGQCATKVVTTATAFNMATSVAPASSTVFARVYMRWSAYPGAAYDNRVIMAFQNAANANVAQVVLKTDGTLAIRSPATLRATTTATIPVDDWFRIEFDLDETALTMELRLYSGANLHGTTPDETISGTLVLTNAPIQRWRLGSSNNFESTTVSVDEPVLSDVAQPGPISVGTPSGTASASAVSSIVAGGVAYDTATGIVFEEDFEGGAVGATIDGTTSVFTQTKGTGSATFASSPTPITGSQVGAFDALGSDVRLKFDFASANVPVTYVRGYFRVGALPTTFKRFLGLETSETVSPPGEDLGFLAVWPTGKIRLLDASGYFTETASAWLSATEWVRLEWRHDQGAGTSTLRVFGGANLHGTTPDEEVATTSTKVSSGGNPLVGFNVLAIADLDTLYADAIAVGVTDWIGPAITIASGTGSLSGTSSVSSTGSKRASGTASASAASSVSSTGAKRASGTAALAATSSTSSSGAKVGSGSDALSASSSVSSTGSKVGQGSASAAPVASSVSSSGAKVGQGTASASAISSTSASGLNSTPGSGAGTASASAVSSVAATGSKSVSGSGTLAATSSAVSVGLKAALGVALTSAVSAASATGSKTGSGTASASASSSTSATGLDSTPAESGTGTGSASAASSISATGRKTARGSGSLTSASSEAVSGSRRASGSASVSSVGSTSAVGLKRSQGFGSIVAVSSVSGVGVNATAFGVIVPRPGIRIVSPDGSARLSGDPFAVAFTRSTDGARFGARSSATLVTPSATLRPARKAAQ